MSILVRKMEPADVPAVAAIDRDSFTLPWPESSYRYEVQQNTAARCFVVEETEHGIIALVVSWLVMDELHIATIATHPNHRRRGIGSQLLKAVLEDARVRGAHRVFLEVRDGNLAAQDMYRKFGFEMTGRRSRYYRDNGEDAILMTLELLEAA